MNLPQRKWLHHDVPNWIHRSEYPYFLTINAKFRGRNTLAKEKVASKLHESVIHRQNLQQWHLNLMVIMPDHIHLIVHFPEKGKSIKQVVTDWKTWIAKNLKPRTNDSAIPASL